MVKIDAEQIAAEAGVRTEAQQNNIDDLSRQIREREEREALKTKGGKPVSELARRLRGTE